MANALIVNTPSQAYPVDNSTHGQVTVSSTALVLKDEYTVPTGTTHVLVQVNGATARVTLDGTTDPDATTGFRYVTGSSAYWPILIWNKARAIREGSTDVVVEIQPLNYRA